MRHVIVKREPRIGRTGGIENGERSGVQVEVIAIAARIKTEDRAKQEADRRFVRNDANHLARVAGDDIEKCRHGACRDREARLTAFRRKVERIGLPLGIHVAKFRFGLAAGQPFPDAVIDLEETGLRRHRFAVRLGENLRCFHGPSERRGVESRDRLGGQAPRKCADLASSGFTQLDIGRSGKSILG